MEILKKEKFAEYLHEYYREHYGEKIRIYGMSNLLLMCGYFVETVNS
jgi:hypothetical protein